MPAYTYKDNRTGEWFRIRRPERSGTSPSDAGPWVDALSTLMLKNEDLFLLVATNFLKEMIRYRKEYLKLRYPQDDAPIVPAADQEQE